jgi:hypothetical protein
MGLEARKITSQIKSFQSVSISSFFQSIQSKLVNYKWDRSYSFLENFINLYRTKTPGRYCKVWSIWAFGCLFFRWVWRWKCFEFIWVW